MLSADPQIHHPLNIISEAELSLYALLWKMKIYLGMNNGLLSCVYHIQACGFFLYPDTKIQIKQNVSDYI